jgi:4a-hydroxytetrahydrobiopterin dehydratase
MKTTDSCLVDESCIPCQGCVPPVVVHELNKLLKELGNGWTLNEADHLYKEYKFNNFTGPVVFANKIAEVAEREAHHPDLKIAWGICTVEIWTHKINGLTESDFILAAKIEATYDTI